MTNAPTVVHMGFEIKQESDGRYYVANSSVFKRSGYATLGAAKSAITKQSRIVDRMKQQASEAAETIKNFGINIEK